MAEISASSGCGSRSPPVTTTYGYLFAGRMAGWPQRFDQAGKQGCGPVLAAALAIGADKVGIAKLADRGRSRGRSRGCSRKSGRIPPADRRAPSSCSV
jgi:hypothetical protein